LFPFHARIENRGQGGSVPEWLMGADCKSAGYAYAGSNPARPIHAYCPYSSAVEHSLGKGEVTSSSLVKGFTFQALDLFTYTNVMPNRAESIRVAS
jgi:hypothetical protein